MAEVAITGASRVITRKGTPQVRTVPGAPTSIGAMLGVTERGPVDKAVKITSWKEYREQFGSHLAAYHLPLAVQQFFEEGGSEIWIKRVLHYTDISDDGTLTATTSTETLLDGTDADRYDVSARDPGAYGDNVDVDIVDATNGDAAFFDLIVTYDGQVAERWRNLHPDNTQERGALKIVNDEVTGSRYIRLARSAGVSGDPLPKPQTISLTGGDDDLASLADTDYLGDKEERTGLHAFDIVPEVSLIAAPGVTADAVLTGILDYCDLDRPLKTFAILDPPAGQTASQMATFAKTTAGLTSYSESGAIYWPRIKSLNPNSAVYGSAVEITAPPSGAIMGLIARQDATIGVYAAAAGPERGQLRSAIGLESDEALIEDRRSLAYDQRVNPITSQPGFGVYVDGSRSLRADGNFPSVPESRGAIFIARSLGTAAERYRHRPLNDRLYNEASNAFRAFLRSQLDLGAFASQVENEAFSLEFDRSGAAQQNQVLAADIGLAFAKPAEFVVLTVQQKLRDDA